VKTGLRFSTKAPRSLGVILRRVHEHIKVRLDADALFQRHLLATPINGKVQAPYIPGGSKVPTAQLMWMSKRCSGRTITICCYPQQSGASDWLTWLRILSLLS